MDRRTEVSADKLNLHLHPARRPQVARRPPVTAEDCVARSGLGRPRRVGQKLTTFAWPWRQGPRTIEITLKEPTALLLPALGKPNSNVPFMMPRRIAETDPFTRSPTPPARGVHLQAPTRAAGHMGRLC